MCMCIVTGLDGNIVALWLVEQLAFDDAVENFGTQQSLFLLDLLQYALVLDSATGQVW